MPTAYHATAKDADVVTQYWPRVRIRGIEPRIPCLPALAPKRLCSTAHLASKWRRHVYSESVFEQYLEHRSSSISLSEGHRRQAFRVTSRGTVLHDRATPTPVVGPTHVVRMPASPAGGHEEYRFHTMLLEHRNTMRVLRYMPIIKRDWLLDHVGLRAFGWL